MSFYHCIYHPLLSVSVFHETVHNIYIFVILYIWRLGSAPLASLSIMSVSDFQQGVCRAPMVCDSSCSLLTADQKRRRAQIIWWIY